MIINYIIMIINYTFGLGKIGLVVGFLIYILSKKLFDKNITLTDKLDQMSLKIIYGGIWGCILGLLIFIILPGLLGYYFYYKLKKYLVKNILI